MTPAVEQVLAGVAATLAGEVIPHLAHGYAVGHAGAAAMLGVFVAQDYDRAADNAAADLRAFQRVFAHVLDAVDGRWRRPERSETGADRAVFAADRRDHAADSRDGAALEADLLAELAAVTALEAPDIRVSTLAALAARAGAAAIALHAAVETLDAPWARAADAMLLAAYKDAADRRALFLPMAG